MFDILGVVFILLFFVVILSVVVIRYLQGTKILVLGKKDKRELLFGLGYILLLYLILSNAAGLPMPAVVNRFFWQNEAVRTIGVALCALGIAGFIVCTAHFWSSVRIGVDYENAGQLTTTGIYAYSRNPMYTCFLTLFLGEFLIFPNMGLLAAVLVAGAAFHLTILREEKFLTQHYGDEYAAYCRRVRRYL